MPAEVYIGTRPGRPALLLVLAAVALSGSLGLAWLQIRQTRGLAPEQRLGSTPIWFRPPHGWKADPRNPHRYVLPSAEARSRGLDIERAIEFDYQRSSGFVQVGMLAGTPGAVGAGQIVQTFATQLGRFPALEIRTAVPHRLGRTRFNREVCVRLTSLPRGEVLRVVYEPLIEFRPADEAIFDAVCASIRFDDPTLAAAPQDFLARAGLKAPLAADWVVVGTDWPEIPGLFIGGTVDNLPAWAIGIYRTWLAPGRTAAAMLADFAAERWYAWDVEERIAEHTEPGGVQIAALRAPERAAASLIQSVWLVQKPPEAALLFVYGDRQQVAAYEAAGQIAKGLEFSPLAGWPNLEAAQAAGVSLVADLRKRGPAPRWGREGIEVRYVGSGHGTIVESQRTARRAPEQGYEGRVITQSGAAELERYEWRVDAQAGAYGQSRAQVYGRTEVRVSEQRNVASGPVTRQLVHNGAEPLRWTFTPGEAFAPPPTESILQAWVARGQEARSALLEASSQLGAGTHTELLRALSADGPYPRVIIQVDFWPVGTIVAFDEARNVERYWMYPGAAYQMAE